MVCPFSARRPSTETPPFARVPSRHNSYPCRNSTPGLLDICVLASLLCNLICLLCFAQEPPTTRSADVATSAQSAINLAAAGHCGEALPALKKAMTQVTSKNGKYALEMAMARCAMSLGRTETAVGTLLQLNREFHHDPEVLYLTTHFYSELASRASQELAATAPTSAQAQQLDAEAFESRGDWDKAVAEYRRILAQNPQRQGIHYQIGRVLLSRTPPAVEDANKEFEEELKVNPNSASAEFMLGETARQAGQWDDAIARFTRAATLDVSFDEAYLALGMSLNAAGKFALAVSPLETYVKRQPADPAGHYQLAAAYSRTGRKPQAEKELGLQREAAAKAPRDTH